MSRNLTVHFKRVTYLVEPGPETLPLGGKRVIVREWEDGRVEIQCAGRTIPYSIFDKNPHVAAGAIVENKRLGAVLAVIQAAQDERDRTRLASKKLTLRQKERILAVRQPPDVIPPNRTSLLGVDKLTQQPLGLSVRPTEVTWATGPRSSSP